MAWATSSRRRRLPANWAVIRKKVLDRDGHRCRVVVDGVRCPAPATEVHHLIEAGRNGGRDLDEERFLVAICGPHHQILTQKFAAEQQSLRRKQKRATGVDSMDHPGLLW